MSAQASPFRRTTIMIMFAVSFAAFVALLYGLGIHILSERIAGRPGMTAVQSWAEPPLAATDIVEMQDVLRRLGYYPDPSDGLVGPKTRAAIRAYQASAGLPQDGFPDQDLMTRLRAVR